jgi:hypothetical protein
MKSDPSGYFSIGGLGASMNIQGVLGTIAQVSLRQFVKRAVTGSLQAGRAALNEARKCIRSPRNCRLTVPILVVGTETPRTAEHIQDAQAGNGSAFVHAPFWLTRRSPPHSRAWMRNAAVCRGRARGVSSCDEYPFASTEEGGALNQSRVSLRLVPAWEQSVQGGRLGAFYGACRVATRPTSANPLQDKRRFLTVATTSSPGFWICP